MYPILEQSQHPSSQTDLPAVRRRKNLFPNNFPFLSFLTGGQREQFACLPHSQSCAAVQPARRRMRRSCRGGIAQLSQVQKKPRKVPEGVRRREGVWRLRQAGSVLRDGLSEFCQHKCSLQGKFM